MKVLLLGDTQRAIKVGIQRLLLAKPALVPFTPFVAVRLAGMEQAKRSGPAFGRDGDSCGRRMTMEVSMSQISIAVPLSITEAEAKLYLAIKLFEIGRLSTGQAAELAGYSKRTFMELLGKHGIPLMDYPAHELQDDQRHA
jgi:predicted HTH domain antitoxin